MPRTGHLEAILLWRGSEPAPEVEEWLRERGIDARPMRIGLLLSGSPAAFADSFGVDPEDLEPPTELPVPSELAGSVRGIALPARRRIHPTSET